MRELGFAIVGAATLIALGLWAAGHSDSEEWSHAAHVANVRTVNAPEVTVNAPEVRPAALVGGDSVRLTNQRAAPTEGGQK